MEKLHGHTLKYWKNNAEEDYLKVPISVLKYITCLEERIEQLTIPVVVVPKGTLPNNCKVCGRTIEEMGKMTSMCGVSACPNY
jgi:hypothetical protein|tara:strand:+ start:193 stop:441 length:249 start_codon:yes stop_codon:yes gene_type:complete